jgi:hypothetical protein
MNTANCSSPRTQHPGTHRPVPRPLGLSTGTLGSQENNAESEILHIYSIEIRKITYNCQHILFHFIFFILHAVFKFDDDSSHYFVMYESVITINIPSPHLATRRAFDFEFLFVQIHLPRAKFVVRMSHPNAKLLVKTY